MPSPAALERDDSYDDILRAVLETERGRAFLAEYARRNRNTDTERVLAELARLHTQAAHDRMDLVRQELESLSQTIAQTRTDVAEIKHTAPADTGRIHIATGELDAIAHATERATTEIIGAAERIQYLAAQMRAEGALEPQCDALDKEVSAILLACSFHDITGQRTSKVVNTMRYLEQRVNAMVEIWGTQGTRPFDPADTRPGAEFLSGPARDGEGTSQRDIDAVLDAAAGPNLDDLIVTTGAPPAPARRVPPTIGQSEIDSLFE